MNQLENLINEYPIFRIGLTIVAILIYFIVRKFSTRSIIKRALLNSFDDTRAIYIKRVFRIFLLISLIVIIGIIWEITIRGLSIYIASFLTLIGVGLFATWSVVSNITASFILYFFYPFKIGSMVKVLDGDNSVQGTVLGLSLFSIHIKLADNSIVYYPNNLAIQKGIISIKK